MKSRALTPAGPRDCALGIAVPLDVREFARDLEPSSGKDFAAHFRRENAAGGMREQYYLDLYARVAAGMATCCDAVERLGVRVRRGLRYDDIRALFAGRKVVTIVAHWRFRSVLADDIADPRTIVERLREPPERIHELVRDEIVARAPRLLAAADAMSDGELRRELACVIGAIVADTHSAYADLATPVESDVFAVPAHAVSALHRITFERIFDGAFRASGAIELADGTVTVAQMIEAVPGDFDGLLDLTICHSVILAEAVRAQRRACLVVANRRPAQLRVRLSLYELAVRAVASRPRPFFDVLVEHALQIQKRSSS